jgi:serralysin
MATTPSTRAEAKSVECPDARHGDRPGERFDQAADAAMRDGDVALTFTGDETYQVLVGERGADQLTGGESVDNIFGRDGADTLIGGALVDDIMGMEGGDSIDARAGHDMIEGGMGNDTITGGTGADAFIVDPHSGFDVITDMEVRGEAQGAFDHLALRDIRPDQVSVVDRAEGAFVSWNTDRDADPEGVLLLGVFRADLRQSDFMFSDEPGFVPGLSTAGSDSIFPA